MNVTLKSFCEDVPLADPKSRKSFLVFEQDGVEFRVPVGADAIEAIVRHVYKKPATKAEPQKPQAVEEFEEEIGPAELESTEGATVFGEGDEDFDEDELPPEDDDPVGALELQLPEPESDGVEAL